MSDNLISVVIRQAEISDADYLTRLAIRSKAHWGYSDEFMSLCQNELMVLPEYITDSHYCYNVAERNNEIVGFYALELLTMQQFELEALFVEPQFIGSGIGRTLMQHAKDNVVQHGGTSLEIQGDPNAQKFYLAAGATLVGERESVSITGRFLPVFSIYLKTE